MMVYTYTLLYNKVRPMKMPGSDAGGAGAGL